MKNKIHWVLFLIGLVFAVTGLAVAGGGLLVSGFFNPPYLGGEPVTAVVTGISSDPPFMATVNYTYGGRLYENALPPRPRAMAVGQQVEIFINKDDPDDLRFPDFENEVFGWARAAMVGLGALFFVIGMAFMLIPWVRKRRRIGLKRQGRRISAKITEVRRVDNVTVNGRHPYVIVCSWQGPQGTIYVFTSHYLWDDPKLMIEANSISSLPVFYNPDKMKEYVVDVEELEKFTKGRIVHL